MGAITSNNITNLYLYHSDNMTGLRVLHLSYNKAHIGCLSGQDAEGTRRLRRSIVPDRYKTDTTRGMFCTAA